MDSWVDLYNNNNQWQKVYDFIDRGGWVSQRAECRGARDQIITWGGPIAAFRWDDENSIDILVLLLPMNTKYMMVVAVVVVMLIASTALAHNKIETLLIGSIKDAICHLHNGKH
ncbi:MAG: hypothetical protein WA941_04150 [Nitrososphaeraceae archaeon]